MTGLHYQQVLDNIAMHAVDPNALPYFSYASTGQNAVQRTVAAKYNLGWDFITSGVYLGRYLVDKQSSEISGQQNNNQTWNTVPTFDPDKVILMKYAYDKAFGMIESSHDEVLKKYLGTSQPSVAPSDSAPGVAPDATTLRIKGFQGFYYDRIRSRWFCVGNKKDVPKNACYVGCCGKTYAWVMPEHVRDLSDFTLAMLDIATLSEVKPNGGRAQPIGTFGTTILAQ